MTTTNTPPSSGILPIIFAAAAYDSDPASFLSQYSTYTSGWSVVWASDPTQPNFAFVGSNGTDYIVGIRGSELNFSEAAYVDWFDEDLKVFSQADWNWFVPSSQSSNYNAVIAQGSMNTLNALLALQDVTSGVLLPDYIIANASNNNASIIITGHSLGGDASSTFGPYMQWYINNNANSNQNGNDAIYTNMQVYTFAAPAAGNLDFAMYYDTLYTSSNQWYRVYNTNDIIPNCPATIKENVSQMYNGGPDATQIGVTIDNKFITLSEFFITTQVAIDANMLLHGHSLYTQTNEASGQISFPNPIDSSYTTNDITDWLHQAGAQHSRTVYLNYFVPSGSTQANS